MIFDKTVVVFVRNEAKDITFLESATFGPFNRNYKTANAFITKLKNLYKKHGSDNFSIISVVIE